MQPSTHRSLLASALLWPLFITMVLLAVLYVVGYHEQQTLMRDNLAKHVESIAEHSKTTSERLDRALQTAEHSVAFFRDELIQQWLQYSTPMLQASAQQLRQRVALARDGAYRTRVDQFDAERQAGVWLPKFVDWKDDYWPLLAVSVHVTQSYGRGAYGKYFVDTWFMPAFGGIVIYWPDEPEFIYRAAADFDYRPTEWVTLTLPNNNPERMVRWTSLSFDEVAQMWMISAVAPLYLNAQWRGSVGHDIPLHLMLREAMQAGAGGQEHFILLSADGNVLASDRYHDRLIKQRGHLPLAELQQPQLQQALADLQRRGPIGRAEDQQNVSFAHPMAGGKFVLLHQVSLRPVVDAVNAAVNRGKWLIVLALFGQLLLTTALAYRAYRRAYKDFGDLDAVQERLRIALTDAAYNTREISAISYGISHDLRAPLRHMTGFTQMLRDQFLTRMNADDLTLVHKIEAATQRATGLTEKLLTYLRISQQEIRCKEVNLQSLLERVVVEALAEWPNSKVEWRLSAQMVVYADPVMLRELFYQLFDNALAAVAELPQPVITVDAERQAPYVIITVRDNGHGFDSARAEHLFEMFQRLSAEQERGPGVGLAIARRIVERHGGKIHAQSETGRGSKFIIQLLINSPR